ncbi:MAG TPA: DUF929 family protein [Chloroflexota bacterium]|nr:DUF929 family protein [Chloroflexota bacterium]
MGRQARRRQARQHQRGGRPGARGSRPRANSTPWWLGPWGIGGAVVIIAAIVVILIVVENKQSPSSSTAIGSPPPPGVLSVLTKPSGATLGSVGSGGYPSPWKALKGQKVLTSHGKPVFVYTGAEYCPYCAAERWSMISALSRFGTFKGLRLMQSSSTDVYADTDTFTFLHSTYSSPYITFLHAEIQDRNRNPLQNLTGMVAAVQKYDNPPYVSSTVAGGIPFLDLNNQAVAVSSGYLPSVINGLSWKQIAAQLNNPSSPVAKAILGNANWITASICKTTGNKPASVCSMAPIPSLEKKVNIG